MSRTVLVAALLSAAPATASSAYKNCSHNDVYDTPSASYDLTGCATLNATGMMIDTEALALALTVTGTDVEQLRLVRNNINADDIATLAPVIAEHTALWRLVVDLNNVSAPGAEHLARALENNTVLTSLQISRADVRNAGAVAVSELLRHNRAITYLHIEMNDISTAGVAALGGALQENSVLQSLHLGVNPIFPNGASQLAKALRKNSGLLELNVRYGGLQDGGVVALASALQENQHLRELDVWRNGVNDAGAEALGHMLKKNTVLSRLNLWDNNVTDTGIGAIAEGLAENKMLRSLHVGRNEAITDGAVVHLQRSMYVNEAVTFIDFGVGNTQVGETFEKPLLAACKCNSEMQKAIGATLVEDEQAMEQAFSKTREAAAECRNKALGKVPMRVSIKEMMRAQGINVEQRRKDAIEAAKKLEEFQKEMEKLSPDERAEVQKLMKQYKDKFDSEKAAKGAAGEAPAPVEAKVNVNSPHVEHQQKLKKQRAQQQKGDGEVDQAFGKAAKKEETALEPKKKKKHRATREQQEKNQQKREEERRKKEEL